MVFVGAFSLQVALLLVLYAAYAHLRGLREGDLGFRESACRAGTAAGGLVIFAFFLLMYFFTQDRFDVAYVAGHSNETLPLFFKVTAIWGGQEGSLLLWEVILSLYTMATIRAAHRSAPELLPYVHLVLCSVHFFILFMLNYVSRPFTLLVAPPLDGQGLNPLLQNPYMATHPLLLFTGYVGLAVPYAYACAALLAGRCDSLWIQASRRFTLFAWLFLGLGITVGGRWAYIELAWGGYWGWDPVENASFMPWLTATAFLHSVMIQERRGMLKIWNMVLVMLSFLLTIFGTFIVRSGVLTSVHAFAQSPFGPVFFAFVCLFALFSFGLLALRAGALKEAEPRLDSYLSREAAFLFNNLLLASACFAIFWGTVFPMISEAFTGQKITVGAPYFNAVVLPIFVLLLFLMGAGPLLPWRRTSWRRLKQHFVPPAVAGLALGLLLLLLGIEQPAALTVFSLCGFVIGSIVQEYAQALRAKGRQTGRGALRGMWELIRRNPRRYGGYVVHFAVVLMFIASTAAAVFKVEREFSLQEDQSVQVRNYEFLLRGISPKQTPHLFSEEAEVELRRKEKQIALLVPKRNFHVQAQQPMTKVAIYPTLFEDVYLAYLGRDDAGRSLFRLTINPLMNWFWIGGAVLLLGGILILLPAASVREEVANL